MKISGSVVVPHPVEAVWDAILDPAVLVRTIPGCSRLETVEENSYAMTVTAGVAAIKGTYDGTAVLSDLEPGHALVMRLTGAGAPGTIDAVVRVSFSPASTGGGTQVSYDADAIVGGMVGGVGQRMLSSVSKRMAAEFFTRVGDAIRSPGDLTTGATGGAAPTTSGVEPVGRAGERGVAGTVFTPPAKQHDRDDFLTGIAVGAGLVLLGVVAGRWLGRSR